MSKIIWKVIILAGGKSSRMGQNKAFLKGKDGKIILSKTIEGFKRISLGNSLDLEPVLSSCADYLDAMKENFPHVKICLDEFPQRGPLIGIYSVLKAYRDEKAFKLNYKNSAARSGFVFIPVDMPLLEPEWIVQTMESIEFDSYDAACFDSEIFPLFIENSQNVYNHLEILIRDENSRSCSLKCFLAELKVFYLKKRNSKNFLNMNTQSDYQEYIEGTGS